MPTRSDFEQAASAFFGVSTELRSIARAVQAIETSGVVEGGRLGSQLDHGLRRGATLAASGAAGVDDAGQECLRRAAIIAEYEDRLARYFAALDVHRAAMELWEAEFVAWAMTGGLDAHPGPAPLPPTPPASPPSWADVQRP